MMKKISRKDFIKGVGAIGVTAAVTPSIIAAEAQRTYTSPNIKKIKVGVIGCGSVARKYIPHLVESPYAEVVSLCDIIPERAEGRAKDFNVKNWYPHIDQMMEGVDFELFVNLTDMQEHGRLNRIALMNGRHVWSEKPLANTYKEGVELVEFAESKGLRIWGAPAVVNSPQFAFMAKQINAGNLGAISAGHGSYGHQGPWWSSFFYEKLGGSIPDLGVYNIATLTGLLGPVVSVTAILNIISPTREIDHKGTITVEEEDNAHILMEHKSGAVSHIQCGFNYLDPHGYEGDEIPTLSVIGSRGKMDMIGYDWAPFAVDMATAADPIMKRTATERGTYKWEEGASVICEFLSTGKEPLINVKHTLHVLDIIEAARKSQKTGKRIKLKSLFDWPVIV